MWSELERTHRQAKLSDSRFDLGEGGPAFIAEIGNGKLYTSRSLISASTPNDRLPSGSASQSTFAADVECEADASRRIGNLIPHRGQRPTMAASEHSDGVRGCRLVGELGGVRQGQVVAGKSGEPILRMQLPGEAMARRGPA